MKHRSPFFVLILIFILLSALSCSQIAPKTQVTTLAKPQDWKPPVFPGAVSDGEIQSDLTAVAKTPGAIDETACDCFGFPVHNAVFHAYRSEAKVQDVMDFYSGQMAAEGWQSIPAPSPDSAIFHRIWQQENAGPLVAYLMVAPMEDGRTLIYLSIAESDAPPKTPEK